MVAVATAIMWIVALVTMRRCRITDFGAISSGRNGVSAIRPADPDFERGAVRQVAFAENPTRISVYSPDRDPQRVMLRQNR